MKVIVLGANSFSGQDFVDLLLDNPEYQVIGISRSAERGPIFLKYKRRAELGNYKYYKLDMNRDMQAICDLFDHEKPDCIVNFAAQSEVAPSWDFPEHWYQTNCVALAKMINHLRKQSYLKRYLHISSPEAYGSCSGLVPEDAPLVPSTPYAASKAAADLLLSTFYKQFNFPLVTVRATNVYGAGQQLFKIIPRTAIYLLGEKKIELHGGGKAVKSYIHIRDVSEGELHVLKNGEVGTLYHLGPSNGIAVADVVRTICQLMGRSFEDSTINVSERPGQDAAYLIDSSRALKEFGWQPRIGFEEGLTEVVSWVKGYWSDIQKLPLVYQHSA